jgi:hypothetical protein
MNVLNGLAKRGICIDGWLGDCFAGIAKREEEASVEEKRMVEKDESRGLGKRKICFDSWLSSYYC